MIVDFDDACWSHEDVEWKRGLIRVLTALETREQHAVLAEPLSFLPWCDLNLPLSAPYFRARLCAAQPRANALNLRISPSGATAAQGSPPWTLNADAALPILGEPLHLVLENDDSDRRFIESTVAAFSTWMRHGWVKVQMGGGATMKRKIDAASSHTPARWRTFFLFDSDRLHPDELDLGWRPPSGDGCQGHTFEQTCAAMPRSRWHRLRRRSIENYLPSSVLQDVKATVTAALFSAAVGDMVYFYNMKGGLQGDGVSPVDPNKAIRAARSKGFWLSLPSADVHALERGFGPTISDEFTKVPANHPWPADILAEMTSLADALQDAM